VSLATHIRQEGIRRFVCTCGGRFDAPIRAEARAVATAANAWAELHAVCAPFQTRAERDPAVAKVRP